MHAFVWNEVTYRTNEDASVVERKDPYPSAPGGYVWTRTGSLAAHKAALDSIAGTLPFEGIPDLEGEPEEGPRF